MSDIIKAPWTPEQITKLESFQKDHRVHPYTCTAGHSHGVLRPTTNGWICDICGYQQDWVSSACLDIIEILDKGEILKKVLDF
jgi:ribosomal protein L37AE/L43A